MKAYRITDIEIGMECKCGGKMEKRARNYLSDKNGDEPFDMTISLPDEYIEEKHRENPHLTFDDCEYLWTGYDFCCKLLEFNGFMLHSSAVSYENKAYLFSAPSGTGKSTHTKIWQRVFGEDRAVIINDDKPAIRLDKEGSFGVYGTPWSGKYDISQNIKVPLQAICFVERSETNSIRRVSDKEAIWLILNQTVRPDAENIMENLLTLIDSLLKKIPVYKLQCNMEDEAAIVAYNAMKD